VQSANRFKVDVKRGYFLLASVLSRQPPERLHKHATLELAHHVLKAGMFKAQSKETGKSLYWLKPLRHFSLFSSVSHTLSGVYRLNLRITVTKSSHAILLQQSRKTTHDYSVLLILVFQLAHLHYSKSKQIILYRHLNVTMWSSPSAERWAEIAGQLFEVVLTGLDMTSLVQTFGRCHLLELRDIVFTGFHFWMLIIGSSFVPIA